MLRVAGVHHVLTLDLHSNAIQGFFQVPVDNLVAEPSMAKYIWDRFHDNLSRLTIISKNAGGAKRCVLLAQVCSHLMHSRNRVTSLADKLNVDFALIHRETHHTVEDVKETRLTLVGDVKDKICIMLDDVVDSAHSFLDSAEHLKRCGASDIYIVGTHGILSGNSLRDIQDCEALDEVRRPSFGLKNDVLNMYADRSLSQIHIQSPKRSDYCAQNSESLTLAGSLPKQFDALTMERAFRIFFIPLFEDWKFVVFCFLKKKKW